METENLIKIGKLNRAFGLKGHLRIFINPELLPRLKTPEIIFILQNKNHLPYFVDEFDLAESGHGMIHFDEVKDKTAADLLSGKEIFMDKKFLKKAKAFSSLADFIGFKLMDDNGTDLGVLDDVIQLPQHEVGKFFLKGKEILFPFNDQVITSIDKKKKTLQLKLPEGLLDVYLK